MSKVNQKELVSVSEGFEAIMSIIGDAPEVAAVAKEPVVTETVYDGRGHVLSVNGKAVAKGYKKGAKKVNNAKDTIKTDLLDQAEVVLNRVAAFEGKIGRNKVEGIVVRMADADYCVKVVGHVKPEYASREAGFKPEKNYMTRGNAVNHSPAVVKALISEFKIENENPEGSFGTLLEAKASGIRFELDGKEYSLKVTKKRARVVME